MEREVADLPSNDFFLKVLDRPHYPGEDANGNPPWDRPAPPPSYPAKPNQQVSNTGQ